MEALIDSLIQGALWAGLILAGIFLAAYGVNLAWAICLTIYRLRRRSR
jgi:hypothetical protein